MNVYLLAVAQKAYNSINEPDKSRLNKALINLSKEPPQGDIKKLKDRDGYRARFGDWRILFDIDPDYIDPETNEKGAVLIYNIAPRGGVYKGE